MEKTLDVQGLTEERVRYLKSLIALWRKHADERSQRQRREIAFATHDSKPVGPITRDEIYDHILP